MRVWNTIIASDTETFLEDDFSFIALAFMAAIFVCDLHALITDLWASAFPENTTKKINTKNKRFRKKRISRRRETTSLEKGATCQIFQMKQEISDTPLRKYRSWIEVH